MLRRLAPAALLALAFAGCTQSQGSDTGDFTGEDRQVAEVISDLSDAATRGEAADVCDDLLSARLQEAVTEEDSSCINEVEKAFEDADGMVLDVVEVTIGSDDTEATAEVRSEQVPEDVTRTFELVKEDDSWRIDSFG